MPPQIVPEAHFGIQATSSSLPLEPGNGVAVSSWVIDFGSLPACYSSCYFIYYYFVSQVIFIQVGTSILILYTHSSKNTSPLNYATLPPQTSPRSPSYHPLSFCISHSPHTVPCTHTCIHTVPERLDCVRVGGFCSLSLRICSWDFSRHLATTL